MNRRTTSRVETMLIEFRYLPILISPLSPLMAFTEVTYAHGPSPQSTACRSPAYSRLTTATGSNQAYDKVRTYCAWEVWVGEVTYLNEKVFDLFCLEDYFIKSRVKLTTYCKCWNWVKIFDHILAKFESVNFCACFWPWKFSWFVVCRRRTKTFP